MSSDEPVFRPHPDVRERVYRRAAHLRRRKRVGSGLLAVGALVLACGAAVFANAAHDEQVRVVGPSPAPDSVHPTTTGPSPTTDRLTIRQVDTTRFPRVSVLAQVTGGVPAQGFSVRENTRNVANVEVVEPTIDTSIVFVLDTSGSMAQGDKLDRVKAALVPFLQRKFVDRVAIVGVNNIPALVQGVTDDDVALRASLERLQPANETALWDGLDLGLRLTTGLPRPASQPNIVLVTDGRDTVSSATFSRVRAQAVSSTAAVFTIGLEGPELDGAPLEDLARSSGGSYQVGTTAQLEGMLASVGAALEQQYQLNFIAKASAPLDLEVRTGGLEAAVFNVSPGTVAQGASGRRDVPEEPSGWSFFESPAAKWAISALVLLAVGLALYAVFDSVGGRRRRSSSADRSTPGDAKPPL